MTAIDCEYPPNIILKRSCTKGRAARLAQRYAASSQWGIPRLSVSNWRQATLKLAVH